MKQVILRVDGGIVDAISVPKGVEVIIRDYDMANTIDNELVQTDEDGSNFIEVIFEDTEYA